MSGMRPDDLYELRWVGDPRLSPDGSTVAYVVWGVDREANDYRAAIWTVPVDGSREPRQVTSGERKDADPRWSPDGRWLAFTSTRGGDDKQRKQLYVMAADGPGEPKRLTDLPEEVEHPEWSPDGARILFSARVPDEAQLEPDERKRPPRRITKLQFKLDDEGWTHDRPHHLFVVPTVGSSEPRQLTDGEFDDTWPAWSPDGSRIAFVSARHENWDLSYASDLYVVAAEGGEPERLTATDGAVAAPAWSPGGTHVAYLVTPDVMDEPRHGLVAVIDVASREVRHLSSSLDRNAMPYPPSREPLWDGDSLLFTVEDRGMVPLFRVPADGSSEPKAVIDGTFNITGYDIRDGRIVHTLTTPTEPAELFIGDRKVTGVGAAFTEARGLPAPERFTAISPDGAEVDAWMLRPAGFGEGKTYPLVLTIHGGPFTQYADKFFDEVQVYAGAGYAVAYSNPRGSSGYSEEWGRAIKGPVNGGPGWGTVDYDDLMAVVDEAIKRFPFVDADRMAVMGGSYGGYMTTWIVGHTDRFACGISERAANNLATLDANSDLAALFKSTIGGPFWEYPDEYRRASPVTYATDITTPLLILHSEGDLRCPVNQAEELFAILRSLQREVEFVRFPAEGHELSRSGHPAHRVMRFEAVLDWLDRHLKR